MQNIIKGELHLIYLGNQHYIQSWGHVWLTSERLWLDWTWHDSSGYTDKVGVTW